MFKKFISSFIIGFLALSSIQFANADVSTRIKVDETLINQRNIVVTHPDTDEQYLLYLGSGCGQLKKGQYVDLIIYGDLDGRNDYIKADYLHSCDIEKADAFNQKLFVNYTYVSNTEAHIMDESGQAYHINYNYRCSAIEGYRGKYVYAYMYDNSVTGGLNNGDKITLADMDGECSITGLKKIERKAPVVKQEINKVPSLVSNVTTVPMNGAVALYWNRAHDDIGISHYIISYNRYYFDAKGVPFADMPNQVKTDSNATSFTVSGLENDQYYFFYITAVDTGGNVSSNWSTVVMAIPRSSY